MSSRFLRPWRSGLPRSATQSSGQRLISKSALTLLAEKGADMALIDVSLAGAPVGLGLAEMLQAQRIPFAFLTGYSVTLFPVALRDRPRLEKPFGRDQLLSVIDQLITMPTVRNF